MTKCSILIMSWKRPENVNRIIEQYNNYKVIDEIIVWNNNPNLFVSNCELTKVKAINCNQDFGLDTRFIGSLLSKNRCLITHDDDILVSEPNIENLVSHFNQDHTRIYTYQGRNPVDGKYSYCDRGRVENVTQPTEAKITLTRVACFDKLYAAEYAKLSDVIFYDVDKNLNGEDIAFSYLTTHLSGKLPLVLPLADKAGYTELPATVESKISTKTGYLERRTDLVNRCEIALPAPKYPAPAQDEIVIFGAGQYMCGYSDDSFNYNSDYKKMLVKESNGIKYLSLSLTERDHSIHSASTILLNEKLTNKDLLKVSAFFKGSSTHVKVELRYLSEGKEKTSKRVTLYIKENNIRSISVPLSDFVDETHITLRKIVFYIWESRENSNPVDFCITNLSLKSGSNQPVMN